MKKVTVLQQVLDPAGAGGVSAEYRALAQSALGKKYDFQAMVLKTPHKGINWRDITFYYRHIKKYNPAIIHVRGAAVDGLNAVIAAKLARCGKILVTVHGMYSDLVYIHPLKKWISKHIIEPLIFKWADGISCVCKTAQERPCFNKYRNKMLPFVYNRMPQFNKSNWAEWRQQLRAHYAIKPDAVVGLYVGRMTREKGIEVLVEAVKQLQANWPQNLVLLCVGDGAYKQAAEHTLKPQGVPVIFAGNQSRVEAFYAAADFFILPSLHENHSISLLEACAAHLPCIATRCGGNTETIDAASGLLVETGNPQALQQAILRMYHPQTRQAYRQILIRKAFTQFADSTVDSMLDAVYQQLLEK